MMRVAGTQRSNYDIVEHILYTRRLATHSDWLRVRRRCNADDGTISYNRHLGEIPVQVGGWPLSEVPRCRYCTVPSSSPSSSGF